MKKILALFFAIILLYPCFMTVSAAEAKYTTAGDLYEAWCEEIPDYICGIWSTDGGTTNLTFGIQNTPEGNAGKQEMLDLVDDDSTLTFVYQAYSRDYLLQIQSELDTYMLQDWGLISTALDEQNNCIELGILQDRKGDAATERMLKKIAAQYGSAVWVIYTGEIYPTTLTHSNLLQQQNFLIYIVSIAVIFLLGIFFIFQKRNIPLFQTNHGAATSPANALSTKELENMIRKTAHNTSPELDQRITDAINKLK